MSDSLTCKGCEKRYVWNSKYAGRKVKCRCGQVLLMPAVDPAASNNNLHEDQNSANQAAPQEHQPASQSKIRQLGQPSKAPAPPLPAFELMDETPAPRPRKAKLTNKPDNQTFELQDHGTEAHGLHEATKGINVEADDEADIDAGTGAVKGAAEGSEEDTFELAVDPDALDTAPKISNSALAAALSAKPSAVAAALESREDELTLSPWKEKYIPAMIAVVGTLVHIGLWFLFATQTKHAVIGAVGMMLVEVVILMPIAIAAVFMTARIMNIGFGPMVPALLKVAAIAIGTGGVADILFFKMMLSVEFDYQMLLVAFVLHMFLLGLPMLAIFELELSEMVMIVSIIVVPRIVILFGMGFLFPHWF